MRKFLSETSRLIRYLQVLQAERVSFQPRLDHSRVEDPITKHSLKICKIQQHDDTEVGQIIQSVSSCLSQANGQGTSGKSPTASFHLCLLVYLVHLESKSRKGPLLQLSKVEFDEMKNKKVLTTLEHKTGSNFPNFVRITEENRKWIEDLHEKFVEEKDSVAPKFAFPSPSTQKIHTSGKVPQEDHKTVFRH